MPHDGSVSGFTAQPARIDPRDIERWAWAQELAYQPKIILICLARYADWDTLECYPSQARIAAECGMSERSVRQWLKHLEDEKVIMRREHRADGRRCTDIITLNAPHLTQPADSVRPTGNFCRNLPARVADKQSHRTIQEEHARESAPALFEDSGDLPEAPDAFEDVWAMWPRRGKQRSAKAASRRAWCGLIAKHGIVPVAAAVKHYVASPDALKSDGEYVPAMERWLKAGRWEQWVEQGAEIGLGGIPDWG